MRAARSRILIVLVAVLAVMGGACVDDGELGGPSVGGASAVSVGEMSLSHGELADMVDEWADNEEFLVAAANIADVGTPARRPADLVNLVVNFWVRAEQGKFAVEALADDEGAPTLDLAQAVDAQLEQFSELPAFGDFDEEFQTRFAESRVYQAALDELANGGYPLELPTVEVNSRYGTTSEFGPGVVVVDSPAGPLPAPGALAPAIP